MKLMTLTGNLLSCWQRSALALASAVVALAGLLAVAPAAQASRLIETPGVTSFEVTYNFDGHRRRVLYLRPTANSSTPAPVLVMVHYAGGNPEQMANLTEVSALVRDFGVWVILPDAYGRTWSFDPVRDRNRTDDVGLLTRIIDQSISSYPINPRKIYMAGFSAGAYMTQRYLCEHPERIAAAAYVSATLLDTLRDVCHPALTTPVVGFHGTADTRVDYEDKLGLSSAPDTARFFAQINGCGLSPVRSNLPNIANDNTTVQLDTYGSCSSNDPVHFYTINGGGHTWPGNEYQLALLTGRTTLDIEATTIIWNFVRGFSR